MTETVAIKQHLCIPTFPEAVATTWSFLLLRVWWFGMPQMSGITQGLSCDWLILHSIRFSRLLHAAVYASAFSFPHKGRGCQLYRPLLYHQSALSASLPGSLLFSEAPVRLCCQSHQGSETGEAKTRPSGSPLRSWEIGQGPQHFPCLGRGQELGFPLILPWARGRGYGEECLQPSPLGSVFPAGT